MRWSVKNFSATFTLTQTTTLDFMIEDYALSDNAGGVALDIELNKATGEVPPPLAVAMARWLPPYPDAYALELGPGQSVKPFTDSLAASSICNSIS